MTNPMSATPEQKRASNPAASAWVGANAGSGKTHVLVDRVTRLMIAGVDPAAVLCLTYTKAAAAEMANRLHERLGEWVGISNEKLSQRLTQLGCDDIDPQTLVRARRLFTAALETPGGLKIQTIHAFCERILQLFPVEAGVAPGFEVLESRQTAQLLRESRDDILFEAQSEINSLLAVAFTTVARHTQADNFDGLLERLLSKRHDLKDTMAQYGSLEAIGRELKRRLGIDPRQRPDILRENLLQFDHAVVERLIPLLSSSGATNKNAALLFSALLGETNGEQAEQLYRQLYYKADGEEPKLVTSVITGKMQGDHPWIGEWLSEEYARALVIIEQLDNLTRIEATAGLLTLAGAIISRFDNAKRRRGVYDFDDLILRTRDLLTDRLSAQWILYKLDRGIEHVLVDEAQDTSLAQWQIVNALTEEFFSGEGSREFPNRTVFVVGDRKQSIYGFQGADPAAFEISRVKFRHQVMNVGQAFNDVELTISYRSTVEVLKTVDAVFSEGTRARKGLNGLQPHLLHHESNRKKERGLVELWPLIRPDEKPEKEPWQAPVDREPAKSPRRLVAQKIARTIKSWIGQRYITALNRPVEPGDILILFRTRSLLFDILISELRKAGIPVAGADRLKLFENIAVLDVMALVRFVLLPVDDYSLACILKSPLVPKPLSETQLFEVAYGRGTATLWEKLSSSNDASCIAACVVLGEWLSAAEISRPFEFVSTVLIKARKSFLARLGSEAGDALDALLEASLSYEENHASSLSGFAAWFASEETEIKRNMDHGSGEVRLMTVHGAKGLESSIVILPDTTAIPKDKAASALMFVDADSDGAKLPLWRLSGLAQSSAIEGWKDMEKEIGLEEYRRLLYVAMTRARDELYICGCHNDKKLNENSWYAMVEDALQKPREGKSILRVFESGDGVNFWRFGPDPAWGVEIPVRPQAAQDIPDWLFRNPAYPDTIQKSWSPARVANIRHGVGSGPALARGRVVHKILQELPQMAPDARLEFARRTLAMNKLDRQLADEIVSLISIPEFKDFFGEGSQAEVSIGAILPDGRRMSGKIDRLAIRSDDILVLDYKTDWDVPEELSHDHPYVLQVAAYATALRQAYGDKLVRPAILWTNVPRLDWIADDILQKAVSNMAAIT